MSYGLEKIREEKEPASAFQVPARRGFARSSQPAPASAAGQAREGAACVAFGLRRRALLLPPPRSRPSDRRSRLRPRFPGSDAGSRRPDPRGRGRVRRPTAGRATIVGLRVVGYQTVSPDTIAHYLGIKVGDPYDPEKIRDNFQTLWDVGLLENLSDRGGARPRRRDAVVTIEERPTSQGRRVHRQQEVLDLADQGPPEGSEGRGPAGRAAVASGRRQDPLGDRRLLHRARLPQRDRGLPDRGRLEDREEAHLRHRRGRQGQDRLDHLRGQRASPARAPAQRDAQDEGRTWWRFLSDEHGRTARPTTRPTWRASRRSTIPSATRTSSSRTRSSTSSSRTPRTQRRSRSGGSGSRSRSSRATSSSPTRSRSSRVDQTGQPDSADAPLVVPQAVILREFRDLQAGLGPEPRPPDRGAVADRDPLQVAGLHLLVRRSAVPRGRQPRVDVDVKHLRGGQVLPRPPRGAPETRRPATRSSAGSSPSTRAT